MPCLEAQFLYYLKKIKLAQQRMEQAELAEQEAHRALVLAKRELSTARDMLHELLRGLTVALPLFEQGKKG